MPNIDSPNAVRVNDWERPEKVLIVGDYMWPWYQEVCAKAIEDQGHHVCRYGWFSDFWTLDPQSNSVAYHSLRHRIEYRLGFGPTVSKVENGLIKAAIEFQPTIIWFYNVNLLGPRAVKRLRQALPDTILVQYANDDPFSVKAKRGVWTNFIKSIPFFDFHFAYRHSNIIELKSRGAKNVELLLSYFVPELDFPESEENIPEEFKCDVVFAGHFENDGRIECLEAICAAGYKLNLFGGGWDAARPILNANSPLLAMLPTSSVIGAQYRYAICGAKVALCFFSSLNNDTYTRRCFQIPAMGTTLLCQYSSDVAAMFEANVEAVFFCNKDELVGHLDRLLRDDKWRASVAEAGNRRVLCDGHDVNSRMKLFLSSLFSQD
jgi:spore maturation protein CgeB